MSFVGSRFGISAEAGMILLVVQCFGHLNITVITVYKMTLIAQYNIFDVASKQCVRERRMRAYILGAVC